MTTRSSPFATELIPIGLYDGGELLPDCYILDDSYTVYMEILSPELSEIMQ